MKLPVIEGESVVKKTESNSKKIWIDFENSPHVLFFNPIIKELKSRGYNVVVTARDYSQTFDLADLYNIEYKKIGRHFGKNKIFKMIGLVTRAAQLIPFIIREKPSLALSHVSRSQFLASKLFRLPTIMALDYEYVQQFPFIHPTLWLVPQILYEKIIKMTLKGISSYPGLKEDVYIEEFKPDPAIPLSLGINDDDLVVTIRPPAMKAHYHNHESEELFESIMDFLCSKSQTKLFIVPRTKDQEEYIKDKYYSYITDNKIIIPEKVVNGLDLIWYSDLVISGGGTMIREAAELKVPAYSFFRGEIGAVDHHLEMSGKLTLIENKNDVYTKIFLEKRDRSGNNYDFSYSTRNNIVDNVEDILGRPEKLNFLKPQRSNFGKLKRNTSTGNPLSF